MAKKIKENTYIDARSIVKHKNKSFKHQLSRTDNQIKTELFEQIND